LIIKVVGEKMKHQMENRRDKVEIIESKVKIEELIKRLKKIEWIR